MQFKTIVMVAGCWLGMAVATFAQTAAPGTASAPATDASKQASPASSASGAPQAAEPATDAAAEASPVTAMPVGTSIAAYTALAVKLKVAVSSATAHNGDSVRGALASSVRGTKGHTFAAGTPVMLTLVAVAPAGKISSSGEVTLQVVKVGGLTLASNELVFKGQRGAKELPDSAPAKGAEAMLAAGALLHFEVLPAMPQPATGPPAKPNIASPQPAPPQQ